MYIYIYIYGARSNCLSTRPSASAEMTLTCTDTLQLYGARSCRTAICVDDLLLCVKVPFRQLCVRIVHRELWIHAHIIHT